MYWYSAPNYWVFWLVRAYMVLTISKCRLAQYSAIYIAVCVKYLRELSCQQVKAACNVHPHFTGSSSARKHTVAAEMHCVCTKQLHVLDVSWKINYTALINLRNFIYICRTNFSQRTLERDIETPFTYPHLKIFHQRGLIKLKFKLIMNQVR